MTQPSSTESACAAQGKMLLLQLLSVLYFAAVCTAQENDTEESSTQLSTHSFLQTTILTPTVTEPPVPHLKNTSSLLDVFPTEKVQLTCEIADSPKWTVTWFLNGGEIPESSSDLSLSSERSMLTITAGPSYSGNYTCKGVHKAKPNLETQHSNSLKVTVHDSPSSLLSKSPNFGKMYPGESVTFTCTISWEYKWEYVWSHNDKEIKDVSGNTYTLKPIRFSDSGQYKCKARRPGPDGPFETKEAEASLDISDMWPQTTLSRIYGFDLMYVGETVNFTCAVDASPGWRYTWYKDGDDLRHTSQNFSTTLLLSDAGNYSCIAARGANTQGDSDEIQLSVLDIPVPSLRNVTEWLDVLVNESLKLSCGIEDSSDWTYTWYKDSQKIEDHTVSFDARGATLSISSASATHAGQYKCEGHLKDRSVTSSLSSELTVTVYDERPILTKDPGYEVMFPGESVTFSCHMSVSSGWSFEWYKDDSILSESSNTVSLASIEDSDSGTYWCKAKRGKHPTFVSAISSVMDLNVDTNEPKPSNIQKPDYNKLYVGETVSFECEVSGSSGWEYHWFKNGGSILRHSSLFVISNATETDSGTYHCMASRNKTNYSKESEKRVLHISEIPVPRLKQTTPWLEVFPDETVMLSCGMDSRSEWTYTWYKDGGKIQPNVDSLSFDEDYTTLTIQSASPWHRGRYSCTGQLKTRSVSSSFSSELTLWVYDAPPNVTLTQTPEGVELMHTGDELSFICHVNVSSGWKYLWYKDDQPLSHTGPSYTISSVWMTHAGLYKCQVRRGEEFKSDSVDIKIEVEERPKAEIALLTGWSEAFSTDTLVLQCKVDNTKYTWNFTWFKEGNAIDSLYAEKHMVTPQDDPEQSAYTCQGVRTERPFHSVVSEKRETKNVLLKRRVLLSISGCIFFGIIAVLIGCIFLRVTRRPVAVAERQEENLFLTMAQLKDRGDTRCPLVDYITEEELNAPPKGEEEENGTVCSETTPLPISTEMDQAATTENHDKEGNNGEMVSFKQ